MCSISVHHNGAAVKSITPEGRDAVLLNWLIGFMGRVLRDSPTERQIYHARRTLSEWSDAVRWEMYDAMGFGAA